MRNARSLPALLAAASLALVACSRPEPPKITPLGGHVTAIGTSGIDIAAKLEAHNPNDFDISVKGYSATVTLDHQIKVGTVTSTHPLELPANKTKTFEVPISVKWNDIAALVPLALSNRDVPFEADCKVQLGGDLVDVNVPFKVTGTITHQQLVQAAAHAMPKIPGLTF